MIIDLTGNVSFEQRISEPCDEVSDHDCSEANQTWREWVREKYGRVTYSDLDKAIGILECALLDDRMRDILKRSIRKSVRADISLVICEFETDYLTAAGVTAAGVTAGVTARRIANIDRGVSDD